MKKQLKSKGVDGGKKPVNQIEELVKKDGHPNKELERIIQVV